LISRDVNDDIARVFAAQAKTVAAETELNWIAEGRPADDLYRDAVAESHFEHPPAELLIAPHLRHATAAADAQAV
jgi:hypothetical protein